VGDVFAFPDRCSLREGFKGLGINLVKVVPRGRIPDTQHMVLDQFEFRFCGIVKIELKNGLVGFVGGASHDDFRNAVVIEISKPNAQLVVRDRGSLDVTFASP